MNILKLAVAAIVLVVISIFTAGCIQDSSGNLGPTHENAVLKISHTVPLGEVKVGEAFTVVLNVTAKRSFPAVSIKEALSGLTLVSPGDFIGIDQNTLRGLMMEPAAGEVQSFSFEASCEHAITYTITGFAETPEGRVWESAKVTCVE